MGCVFVKPCCPCQLSFLAGESKLGDLRGPDVPSRLYGRCQTDNGHAKLYWSLLRSLFTLHESSRVQLPQYFTVQLVWMVLLRQRCLLSVLLLVFLCTPTHATGRSLWVGF